ncbi:MAG: right-handed parallel beta-helix repeat-containing protein [Comamonadaceae bacterium]|jgi:hypothetical protein|nr:right-handed parallel beta-helix repeat-containing protein [Comamonadaceae bacterium]
MLLRLLCIPALLAGLAACGGGGGSDGPGQSPSSPLPPSSVTPLPPGAGPGLGNACASPAGRVLEVGPGKTYASPAAAAAAAQSGDTIRISAGDYRGSAAVAQWTAGNLTICGAGGPARMYADGQNARGKGIWVIGGANVTVDGISFHNATVPDQNGAGIRAEHTSGTLRILNSGFYDNENGLLANPGNGSIDISYTEFAGNGRGDGYTHNLYVNQIDRLVVRASFFRQARIGHNLKSRARDNLIENSYFMDGPSGTASYQTDFPNGGQVVLRGNLMQKGPNADNAYLVAYGFEGYTNPSRSLQLVHNTLVSTRSGGGYLYVASGASAVGLTANLFAGTGSPTLIAGGFSSGSVGQSQNVFDMAANIPGASNVSAPNFWPNATLQARIGLSGVPDAAYVNDTPSPFVLRAIAGGSRVAGALQSAP